MGNEKNIAIGIDIGGSHISAGLVDMDKKMVLEGAVIRNRVNRHGDANEILTTWVNTIKELQQNNNSNFTNIGFAMPGPFNYEEGICLIKGFDKYESLYGMNIRTVVAELLDLSPNNIFFRNDAEAFLDGELFCGAAAGFNHAIGITLGTGLGSAIHHNGITRDAELSVLEYHGEKIEEWVSTRGLIRIYKELTGKTVSDALGIAQLYNADTYAKEAFSIFARHLSWFLQRFIVQESPEVLVMGGNIARSHKLFINEVEKNLSEVDIKLPKIVQATLGENALLIGAVCKVIANQSNKAAIDRSQIIYKKLT